MSIADKVIDIFGALSNASNGQPFEDNDPPPPPKPKPVPDWMRKEYPDYDWDSPKTSTNPIIDAAKGVYKFTTNPLPYLQRVADASKSVDNRLDNFFKGQRNPTPPRTISGTAAGQFNPASPSAPTSGAVRPTTGTSQPSFFNLNSNPNMARLRQPSAAASPKPAPDTSSLGQFTLGADGKATYNAPAAPNAVAPAGSAATNRAPRQGRGQKQGAAVSSTRSTTPTKEQIATGKAKAIDILNRTMGRDQYGNATAPVSAETQMVQVPGPTSDPKQIRITVPDPTDPNKKTMSQVVGSEEEAQKFGGSAGILAYRQALQNPSSSSYNRLENAVGVQPQLGSTRVARPLEKLDLAQSPNGTATVNGRTVTTTDDSVRLATQVKDLTAKRDDLRFQLDSLSPEQQNSDTRIELEQRLAETEADLQQTSAAYDKAKANPDRYFVDQYGQRVGSVPLAGKWLTVGNKKVPVSIVGNQVFDEQGRVIDTVQNAAAGDKDFRYATQLDELTNQYQSLMAAGRPDLAAGVKTQMAQLEVDYKKNRDKDKKRFGWKDQLLGLGLGALQGFAQGGIGGAIGGGATGLFGSMIDPDFEQKLAEPFKLAPSVRRLQEAQANEAALKQQRGDQIQDLTKEAELVSKNLGNVKAALENNPIYKSWVDNPDQILTPEDADRIRASSPLLANVDLPVGRTSKSGNGEPIWIEGVLHILDPVRKQLMPVGDGRGGVVTDRTKTPKAVTIGAGDNAQTFVLGQNEAARMVADFYSEGIKINNETQKQYEDRYYDALKRDYDMAMKRYEAYGTLVAKMGESGGAKTAAVRLAAELQGLRQRQAMLTEKASTDDTAKKELTIVLGDIADKEKQLTQAFSQDTAAATQWQGIARMYGILLTKEGVPVPPPMPKNYGAQVGSRLTPMINAVAPK